MKSFFSCYFNLVKASIGSGLISYPITFHYLGYYIIIPICISSIFSQLGFYFYLKTNKLNGPLSISSLSKKYKNFWSIIAHTCVILKTFLVSISYLIALNQIYKIILPEKILNKINSRIIVLLHTLLIFPLICLKQIKYLNHSSFIGILSTSYIIILAIYRYIKFPHLGSIEKKFKFFKILERLPFFVFSFTAHQTIIPLQNDYFHLPLSFFIKVVIASSITVTLIYSLFGILISKSLNMSGETYKMLCFNIFPKDYLTIIALITYLLLLSFSIPLQLIPCRIQLIDIYNTIINKNNKLINSKNDYFKRILCSLFIIIICLLIFLMDLPMDFFQKLSGGTSSTILCFILPSAIFYGLCWKNSSILDKFASFACVFYGLIIFLIFLYTIFFPSN